MLLFPRRIPRYIAYAMYLRTACYVLLVVIIPAVLFTFHLFFGAESYQYWGERYHLNLTNKYLFSRIHDIPLPGPLWREDTLSGGLWIASLVTSPLAFSVVVARTFHLSPFWLDLFQTLFLYVVTVVSMFWYLHRSLELSLEGATTGATVLASALYWNSTGEGMLDTQMGVAWLPLLLALVHVVHDSKGWALFLPVIGLAVAFYGYALNSSPSTLVTVVLLLGAYTLFVFPIGRFTFLTCFAVALGLLLYSPFLWSLMEAAQLSQRYLGDYFQTDGGAGIFSVAGWLTRVQLCLARLVVGHNHYGVYLVVVLTVLVWIFLGPRWGGETGRNRRILTLLAGITVVSLLLEFFSEEVNFIKRDVPFLGGWSAERFAVFTVFGVVALFAWMLERTLFNGSARVLSDARWTWARRGVIVVGMLGMLQVVYSAFRMRLVPASIAPQNHVLYAYLLAYAVVTLALLVLVYQRVRCRLQARPEVSGRLWCVTLIALSVALTASVHGYRSGVLPARGGPNPEVIKTYSERYSGQAELRTVKDLNRTDERIVDLTRAMPNLPWIAETEAAELPLNDLRTPSGYSVFFPSWYGRFIEVAINGGMTLPFLSVVQVRATERTNFEALGLLAVQYVLARKGNSIPGYAPVFEFDLLGKTLFSAQGNVAPVFVSTQIQCFTNDMDALRYIHAAGLRELKTSVVLVSGDADSARYCRQEEPLHPGGQSQNEPFHMTRGRDRISIEVDSSPGGILTLADTYYPGWKVYVNGVEKPILRTYTTLRGVEITPGRQVIEFVYSPDTFWSLFRLSNGLLGGMILFLLAGWTIQRFPGFWRRSQNTIPLRGPSERSPDTCLYDHDSA